MLIGRADIVPEFEKAVYYYQQGIKLNDPECQNDLGVMYEEG